MGLTKNSVGSKAVPGRQDVHRVGEGGRILAFAGNPNVGKSTLFNSLTGMKQHTGNWPGKTVETAVGFCQVGNRVLTLVDLPGTYSLMTHSREEEVAREFICSGEADGIVVVCDATCLERNLNLVLQVAEMTPRVLLCVNLMDEAERKGITVDTDVLARELCLPVVATSARDRESIAALKSALCQPFSPQCVTVPYPEPLEKAVEMVAGAIPGKPVNARWQARRLLEGEPGTENAAVRESVREAQKHLETVPAEKRGDLAAEGLMARAAEIYRLAVRRKDAYSRTDRKLDRFFTGRVTGFAAMLLLLAVVFWITIVGANFLSSLLLTGFSQVQEMLRSLCFRAGVAPVLQGILLDGIYRVLTWVISVMLPPMAIFFPLFTVLEDAGILPRIAYNLDRPFARCCACGKQALSMCMGFGCNAAGVAGCRIIDSPRERLLAILTNSFVPCNGRFPALLLLITLFFVKDGGGAAGSLASAGILTGVILLGIAMTFGATWLLSMTVLKGEPSSFTLELPSYRRPQIGSVIVRSVVDRTLFVLGRAAAAAAPAGLLIYLLGNFPNPEGSLLIRCSRVLSPVGALMGMDGVILLAFLLGLPANEIVIPIILMIYTQAGSPVDPGSMGTVGQILRENGWTLETAICTVLFFLMHWPCSTTLLTVRKETGSWKWTGVAALLPTIFGIVCCMAVHGVFLLFG